MKKITIITFILVISSFVQAQDMKGMDMHKKETKEQMQPVTYTCVMHPEIHATKPGNCPKCGMKLIKEKPKEAKPQPTHQKQICIHFLECFEPYIHIKLQFCLKLSP